MKIVVFYHSYLFSGDPPDLLPGAFVVVSDQMKRLQDSGLADAASEIICGINGGDESREVATFLMPAKAKLVMHGLASKNENLTLVEVEKWVRANPEEAYVLYFHAKSSSHVFVNSYADFDWKWKECLMHHCVDNWRDCVRDLGAFETVGCHWLTGQGSDHSQHYYAGTIFWARASYLRTLPSIYQRERIKVSGIGHPDSRYEAEVWLGNGPRLPTIRDYHPGPIAH
jgi:hypothetical protein